MSREDKSTASVRPRIGPRGIESLTSEAGRYENFGLARMRPHREHAKEVGMKDTHCIYFMTNESDFNVPGYSQGIFNTWLDERDWYFVNVQTDGISQDYKHHHNLIGELYKPKPDVIPVTNIQVGEEKP